MCQGLLAALGWGAEGVRTRHSPGSSHGRRAHPDGKAAPAPRGCSLPAGRTRTLQGNSSITPSTVTGARGNAGSGMGKRPGHLPMVLASTVGSGRVPAGCCALTFLTRVIPPPLALGRPTGGLCLLLWQRRWTLDLAAP